MLRLRRLELLLAAAAGLAVLGGATAGATSPNISHAYHAEGSIASGSLVSLDPNRSNYVQLANTTNGGRLTGVAVAPSNSLLEADPKAGTIQVATNGSAVVMVSTVNGDIKVGDKVAVSPFNGVGMKSLPGYRVIGLAETAFTSHTAGATSQMVKDRQGHPSRVEAGYLEVNIAISTDAISNNGGSSSSLTKLAQSLTGHAVSPARVILSLIVAVVTLGALITLIYGAIYSSIIAVGRNPLAKYSVFKALGSILAIVLLTASAGSIIIIFLMK